MEDYRTKLVMSIAKAKKIALENICRAQQKQKEYYDHCCGKSNYEVGEWVMVYMHPEESSQCVAISRLRRCYPELPDAGWTGIRKRKPCKNCLVVQQDPPVLQKGPFTRAMAQAEAETQEK